MARFSCARMVAHNIYDGIGYFVKKYLKEEISEKIRLFYVALTRAREKMILINPISSKESDYSKYTVLPNMLKLKYRSIADMVNSIEFRINDKYKNINIDNLGLTGEYNDNKVIDLKSKINKIHDKLDVSEISIKKELRENKSFSKKNNKLITKDEYSAMKLGTDIHEYLEFIDLKNPDYSLIDNKFYLDIIKNLLNQELLKNISKGVIYYAFTICS